MCSAGSVHAGLTHGLSRMTGNCHVRFLGEGVAVMPPPYPTAEEGAGSIAGWRQGGSILPLLGQSALALTRRPYR
jgi:hypothetical protein